MVRVPELRGSGQAVTDCGLLEEVLGKEWKLQIWTSRSILQYLDYKSSLPYKKVEKENGRCRHANKELNIYTVLASKLTIISSCRNHQAAYKLPLQTDLHEPACGHLTGWPWTLPFDIELETCFIYE